MSPSITLDNLAVMIKTGFDEVGVRLDNLERGQAALERGQAALEQGQEDIKLRLDNAAHRFELVELDRRVKVLERKAGVSS